MFSDYSSHIETNHQVTFCLIKVNKDNSIYYLKEFSTTEKVDVTLNSFKKEDQRIFLILYKQNLSSGKF